VIDAGIFSILKQMEGNSRFEFRGAFLKVEHSLFAG
jgi:hypothetical protein